MTYSSIGLVTVLHVIVKSHDLVFAPLGTSIGIVLDVGWWVVKELSFFLCCSFMCLFDAN